LHQKTFFGLFLPRSADELAVISRRLAVSIGIGNDGREEGREKKRWERRKGRKERVV